MLPVHTQPVETEDRPNGLVRFVCPCCGGEGGYEVSVGYRQYGWGYGDCEEVFDYRTCSECDGSGFYEEDYSPCDPRGEWDEMEAPVFIKDPTLEDLLA